MKFLTSKNTIQQTDEPKKFYTLHNQLFKDENDIIYFVPRYMKTDGYTIPNWLAWIGGGKTEFDLRPAIQHDFECRYHQAVIVKLSENELREKGFLRHHEKKIGNEKFLITVCDNIPYCYLEVIDVEFEEANDRFKRAMSSLIMKQWRINMMRLAVNFNIGWLYSGKKKVDIGAFYKDFV